MRKKKKVGRKNKERRRRRGRRRKTRTGTRTRTRRRTRRRKVISHFSYSIFSTVGRINGIFDIRIAPCFIYKRFASLCCVFGRYSHTLCTGHHFEPAQSLLRNYYRTSRFY